MERPQKTFKNRRLLVEGQFQIKYSLILASIGFTFCLVVGIGLILLLKDNYDFIVNEGLLQSPTIVENLSREESKLLLIYFTLSVLVVGLFFYAGLYLTNRFVGPVKALARELLRLKLGDFSSHLRLRANDEMNNIADIYNEATQVLREEIQKDIDTVQSWKQSLQEGKRKDEISEEMDHWIHERKSKISPKF